MEGDVGVVTWFVRSDFSLIARSRCCMPRSSLTRRLQFSAAHRYRREDWTDAENEAVFGACAHKNFHGHTYTCDITVSGPIDEETGFVVDLGFLDEVLQREVTARFDHRNINLDVAEFGEGRLIPGIPAALPVHARGSRSAIAHRSFDGLEPDPSARAARADPTVDPQRQAHPRSRPGSPAPG